MGKGEVFLRDGRVQQPTLLVLLGQILQIEELRELRSGTGSRKIPRQTGLDHVFDEVAFWLDPPNIRLSASGTAAGRLMES